MKRVIFLLSVLVGAASAACASATAKTPPERPALEVPAPPAKVVEPSPKPETEVPPVPELPPAQPNTRSPRPPVREPARTEPKPETTAPTEPPAAPVAPVTPPPQLRPANTPDASEASKQAHIAIDRAKQALNSLNSKQLEKAKRPVYDEAVRMLALADDSLKKSDFENAKKLAEKVESTAKELGAK